MTRVCEDGHASLKERRAAADEDGHYSFAVAL